MGNSLWAPRQAMCWKCKQAATYHLSINNQSMLVFDTGAIKAALIRAGLPTELETYWYCTSTSVLFKACDKCANDLVRKHFEARPDGWVQYTK